MRGQHAPPRTQNGPVTRRVGARGLVQRAASGRVGFRQKRPAGQGCRQGVVVNARRQIGRRHAKRGREIYGSAAAETVVAAGKSLVVPVLMFGFAVMVSMLLGAGLGVSDVQMKRGMGIAARKRERQQYHQAAQEERPLHRTITYHRRVGKVRISRIAQGRLKVKLGPNLRRCRVACRCWRIDRVDLAASSAPHGRP